MGQLLGRHWHQRTDGIFRRLRAATTDGRIEVLNDADSVVGTAGPTRYLAMWDLPGSVASDTESLPFRAPEGVRIVSWTARVSTNLTGGDLPVELLVDGASFGTAETASILSGTSSIRKVVSGTKTVTDAQELSVTTGTITASNQDDLSVAVVLEET